MREALVEYLVNAAWQLPLLAGAALLLARLAEAPPRQRCWIWSLFLALSLLLPLKLHPLGEAMTGGAAAPALVAPAQLAPAAASPGAPGTASLALTPEQAGWVVGLFATVTALAAARLLAGAFAARRLVKRSRPLRLPDAAAQALAGFAGAKGLAVPAVRTCPDVAGPVTIGALRPVILVPPGFERQPAAQARAALLHEAAHVQRGDYGANLLWEVATLPLAWHPALYPIKAGLRASREAACDALAAAEMRSPELYAECLVALARQALAARRLPAPALAMFGRGPVERRVRSILALKSFGAASLARSLGAAVVVTAGVVIPALAFHVTPSFAREVRLAPAAAPGSEAAQVSARAKAAPVAVQGDAERQVIIGERHGGRRHTWIAADGTRYVVFNGNAADLTPKERAATEAATRKSLAEAQRQVEQAQREVEHIQRDVIPATAAQAARVQTEVASARRAVASIDQQKIAAAVARAQAEVAHAQAAAKLAQARIKVSQDLVDGRVQRELARAQAELKARRAGVIILGPAAEPPPPPPLPEPPPPPPAPPPAPGDPA